MRKLLPVILAALLVVPACKEREIEEVKSEEVTAVKVERVESRVVEQEIEFTGNIEPLIRNNISSAAAQRIEKIFVDVGSKVRKGDLLVEMESVNLTQASIQLENLKSDLYRTEALYKAGGISEQQYNQILTQVKVAEESIENLNSNTKLLSPIDGVITHKNFDAGDLAAGQPILIVMQMQPVKILINISEEFFPMVKVGTPATIKLDIYPDKSFPGKVMKIHPVIDPLTHSFVAEVRIENRAMEIRPGMFARAVVNFGALERVVVSDQAVVKQVGTNDKYLFVLNEEGDRVSKRKVELGRRVGRIYEVLSGVEPGEMVVVAGQSYLMDNSKVELSHSQLELSSFNN